MTCWQLTALRTEYGHRPLTLRPLRERTAPLKKKIILHIGPHKTGTTAIQSAFWNNRTALSRQGILYPKACRFHYAQHRLSFSLKNMRDPKAGSIPDFQTELGDLTSEITSTDPNVIVLSSEEFFRLPADSMQKLRDSLEEFDVQVVAFIRNPVDAFSSLYNQNAKEPKNKFVHGPSQALREADRLFPQLDFAKFIQKWADVFGESRIKLLEYEAGDAIEQFLDVIGWEGDFKIAGHFANRSIDFRAVELIRLAKVADLPVEKRQKLAGRAMEFFNSAKSEHILAPEERKALLDRLNPGYDEVFRKYLGKENPYRQLQTATDGPVAAKPLNRIDLLKMMAHYM